MPSIKTDISERTEGCLEVLRQEIEYLIGEACLVPLRPGVRSRRVIPPVHNATKGLLRIPVETDE